MRYRVCVALLLLGGIVIGFAGCLWWIRATADVGRPHAILYVLTALGPVLAVAGAVGLRTRAVGAGGRRSEQD